jgi:hypothetical protein
MANCAKVVARVSRSVWGARSVGALRAAAKRGARVRAVKCMVSDLGVGCGVCGRRWKYVK